MQVYRSGHNELDLKSCLRSNSRGFESLRLRQRGSGIYKNFTSPIHKFLKKIAEMLISVLG